MIRVSTTAGIDSVPLPQSKHGPTLRRETSISSELISELLTKYSARALLKFGSSRLSISQTVAHTVKVSTTVSPCGVPGGRVGDPVSGNCWAVVGFGV